MNPKSVTQSTQDFSIKLTPPADGGDVVVFLSATNAGDGDANDFVRWRNARLTGGNKPDLALRDVPGLAKRLAKLHDESLALTTRYLDAAIDAKWTRWRWINARGRRCWFATSTEQQVRLGVVSISIARAAHNGKPPLAFRGCFRGCVGAGLRD